MKEAEEDNVTGWREKCINLPEAVTFNLRPDGYKEIGRQL